MAARVRIPLGVPGVWSFWWHIRLGFRANLPPVSLVGATYVIQLVDAGNRILPCQANLSQKYLNTDPGAVQFSGHDRFHGGGSHGSYSIQGSFDSLEVLG